MKVLIRLLKLIDPSCFLYAVLLWQPSFANSSPAIKSESLGQFWVTFYYLVDAKRYSNVPTKVVRDVLGETIVVADQHFLDDANREGTAWLLDGRVINFSKVIDHEIRYKVTDSKFGNGIGRCVLTPYRTIAVDPSKIPFGTEVFIPKVVGMKLPDGTIHDGHFMAFDRGGMVNDKHIDMYSKVGPDSAQPFIDQGIDTRSKVEIFKVQDPDPRGCHTLEPNLTGKFYVQEGVASHLAALIELLNVYTIAQQPRAIDYINAKISNVRGEWESMGRPVESERYTRVWRGIEIEKIEKILHPTNDSEVQELGVGFKSTDAAETLLTFDNGDQARALDDLPRISEYNGSHGLQPKEIILTFDDGPNPIVTPQILNTLLKENVPATFFEIGEEVLKYPDLTREVAKGGFGLGNHTYTHRQLTRLSDENIVSEIQSTQTNLVSAFGGEGSFDLNYFQPLFQQFFEHPRSLSEPEFFRAPYGDRNKHDLELLYQFDTGVYGSEGRIKFKHIMWNIDSVDWQPGAQPKEVLERVKAQLELRKSGIILFHDRIAATAVTIDRLIPELKVQGYHFLSIYDLMKRFNQP